MKRALQIFAVAIALLASVVILTPISSQAADNYWIGGSSGGDWKYVTNWSEGDVPANGDNAFLINAGQVELNMFDSPAVVPQNGSLQSLLIDGGTTLRHSEPGSTLTTGVLYVGFGTFNDSQYTLVNGNLTVYGFTVIGGKAGGVYDPFDTDAYGEGTFNQSGGSFTTGGLYLGDTAGSTGTYNLYNGNLIVDSPWAVIGANGGTGVFNQSGGSFSAYDLGVGGSGVGTYNLSNGALAVNGNMYVGDWAQGTFNQTGGSATVSNLILASNWGTPGTYNLSGDPATSTLNTNFTIVGQAGTGTFTQTGGKHEVTYDINLGQVTGSEGTYNLSGTGEVYVGRNLYVGLEGTGVFTQSGTSQVNVTGGVVLSSNTSGAGVGTYNLQGGSLTSRYTNVGAQGEGTFNQTGGLHSTGDLLVGDSTNGSGSYSLSGTGSQLKVSGNETIGGFGNGTFSQTDGSHSVNYLFLAYGNVLGNFNLSDGTLTAAIENIGIGGTGVFTQTGGANTVTNRLNVGIGAAGETFGTGIYNLKNGTLSVGINSQVGVYGTGTFNQSGGTHEVGGTLYIGKYPGSTGTYNLNEVNGTANLTVKTDTVVGYAGTGTFNQTAGTHAITNNLILGGQFTDPPGYPAGTYYGTGTYNLSGASSILTVGGAIVVGQGGTGTFNQSGGTLTAANIINNDKFNYSGGNLNANITNNANFKLEGTGERVVNGTFTNNAAAAMLEIANTQAKFTRDVTNYGTVKVTNSTVTFEGTYYEYGVYNSDPSTNYFANLIIGPTGYLTGGPGDVFNISGNFLNNTQNPAWDTENADLIFSGSGPQIFQLSSLDQANKWDMLSLLNGAILNISGSAGSKLYVDEIVGNTGNIVNTGSNPITIYYDGGEITLPGSGQPVPEPSTLLLLGSGLLGAAGFLRRRFKKN